MRQSKQKAHFVYTHFPTISPSPDLMPGKAKVLTPKEIQTLFKILKTDRDRALFITGLYTGLRISEIIAINQKDMFTTSGGVHNILKVTRLKKRTQFKAKFQFIQNSVRFLPTTACR